MAGTVLLSVEGVIGAPERSEGPLRPIPEGLLLFHALRAQFRVTLSSSTNHPQRLEQWLALNGVTTGRYDLLYTPEPVDADLSLAELRGSHLDRLRAHWGDVSMMVDPDPAVVLHATRQGVIGVLFVLPGWRRPEWRPDHPQGLRSWSEIEQEVSRHRELKERASAHGPTQDAEP